MRMKLEVPTMSKMDYPLLKILIVEDSIVLQKTAKRFFIKAGIVEENIVIAKNGLEAVNVVKANPDSFDVIYMDEQMPVMNGHEATLLIREEEKGKRSKSIIFTCSSSYLEVFRGANTRLEKPMVQNELNEFLSKVVTNPNQFWPCKSSASKARHKRSSYFFDERFLENAGAPTLPSPKKPREMVEPEVNGFRSPN